MASNKSKFINDDNVSTWLSALGFSFPRNEAEEKVFDLVYSNYEHKVKDVKIDASRLIDDIEKEASKIQNDEVEWKMAARNYGDLPKHIMEKMRKNQNGKEGNSQED